MKIKEEGDSGAFYKTRQELKAKTRKKKTNLIEAIIHKCLNPSNIIKSTSKKKIKLKQTKKRKEEKILGKNKRHENNLNSIKKQNKANASFKTLSDPFFFVCYCCCCFSKQGKRG